MSKLTQIENALIALDPASFHRLCDSYLYGLGYRHINRIGVVAGAEKVVTGTPDTFVSRPDGTYDFAEYSTQQEGLAGKLKSDLAKCFDEVKTGVPIERIHEIIVCHNSKLTVKEDFELVEECRRHRTRLSIFGLSKMAQDFYQKYPMLAKDFLGIEVDTGQILTTDEFVKAYNRTSFATPLDTVFRFREDELQRVRQVLEEKDLILITGRAGLGKTRLALEACRRYCENHPDAEIRCIFNKGADIFQDLREHFSAPGYYLILVDDTNRVNKFEYALQFLHEQRDDRKIKIIATVRDYALDSAKERARPFGGSEVIELEPFKDDQIKELVSKDFGITNHLYLERIADIAKGNARLALMAAHVAKQENKLESIADVSSLYDEYFASIRGDLKELGDMRLILVAGIISFFRAIDRSNAELMGAITANFGIQPEAFWKSVTQLHELEVVDMYENEVVRISDQVLSTYLFYLAVFRERALDFTVLLEQFFPKFRYRMTDALYPVLDAFDSELITTTLRPHVDRAWAILLQRTDDAALMNLLDVFWFVKPTDTLVYLRDKIRTLEPSLIPVTEARFTISTALPETPSILGVLDNFRYADEASITAALSLLFDYAEKRPAELSLVVRMLTERYGMTHYSHLNGFAVERLVTDALWSRSPGGQDEFFSRLFLTVAEPLLHTHFQTSQAKSRLSISIINFDVPLTAELLKLRQVLWQRVFSLYSSRTLREHILELFEKHNGSGYLVANREIVSADALLVQSFFKSNLDPSVYRHCAVVQDYLEMLERIGVEYDPDLKDRFRNETYDLSDLFFIDRRERRELGWEEYEKLRRERLRDHTASYDAQGFAAFFERCAEIIRTADGQQFKYQVQQGAAISLLQLAERDSNLFTTVLSSYLHRGNVLDLWSGILTEKLIQICGPQRSYEILSAGDYPQKASWLFSYFVALSADAVTEDHLRHLHLLYETAKYQEIMGNFDYLLKFTQFDHMALIRVIHTLVEKSKQESGFGHPLTEIFNGDSEVGQNLGRFFDRELELLKRAYFASSEADPHHDYDGHFFDELLDLDPNFAQEWISWLFNRSELPSSRDDNRDYSFLWSRPDHMAVLENIIDSIRTQRRPQLLLSNSYLQKFFVMTEGTPDLETIYARQDAFLDEMIRRRSDDKELMSLLFGVISNFGSDRRRGRILTFLRHNQDFEAFSRLRMESTSWGWTGSAVPMLQKRVDFLESLIPAMKTVELLNHKQRIEHMIQSLRDEIEREKRRDFIGNQ